MSHAPAVEAGPAPGPPALPDRTGPPRAATRARRRLPAALLVLLVVTTAGSGLGGLPLSTAAGLTAVLGVLTLAGAGVWRLVVPGATAGQAAACGCLLGLGLVGFGVWLSGVTGVFALRWAPPALALLAWLPAAQRRRPAGAPVPPVGAGWWGAVAGTAALLVSVQRHLATAPRDPGGWRSWYVDVPWHIAFTAESLERAPSQYPWVPDVSLGYTWLFSAALGGWGSATSVSAADLIVRVGPAVLAALLPTVVALLAWEVSRSRLATALAPVLVVLAQAPLFIFRDTMDITAQWLIPNRDYAHLWVLLVLLVAVASSPGRQNGHLGGRRGRVSAAHRSGHATGRSSDVPPVPRWQRVAVLALLCFGAYTAAGSKGSALPALAGALGVMVLYALVRRRHVGEHLARLAAVGAGMALAQNTVTKSLSYLRIDPFTFTGGQGVPALVPVLPWVVTALVLSSLLYVAITVLPDARLVERALPLVGAGLAGLTATVVFGHPGLSQLYFLHAAWPVICTAVAVALAWWARLVGAQVLLGFGCAAALFAAVLAPPADGRIRTWAAAALVVLAATLLLVLAPVLVRALSRGPGRLRRPLLACTAAVLSAGFVVQNWGLPGVALPVSVESSAADAAAVDGGQLAVYAALHDAADPEDLVMTNKHCQTGSVPAGDCDPRWFGVSAFAERRVLVEGWSYTKLSAGVPRDDVYWRPELLRANDTFIAEPDPTGCRRFLDAEVRWVFVDKREAWSPRLADVARRVADTPSAALYELRPGCDRG